MENDFIHRIENNIQRPARPAARVDESITMTRAELEQALQSSEMQEILHNARMGHSSPSLGINLRTAIIDRLFLWQSVNRSIRS